MNSEKLLDAIGMVGEDLILEAKARQKKHITWKHWTLIAACLAVIVISFAIWHLRNIPDPVVSPSPQEFQITHIPRSSSPDQAYVGSSPYNPTNIYTSPSFPFIYVTARAIEVLPDSYMFYHDWYRESYRLVKMETVNPIVGLNMVDEFYLVLQEKFIVDFTQYDTLILTHIYQRGAENNILYNCTTDTVEVMDCMLFGTPSFNAGSTILAFTDNVFDESLWMINGEWIESTQLVREQSDDPSKIYGRGKTLAQVEAAIREYYSYDNNNEVQSILDITSVDGAAALDYVTPFKNGTFSADFDYQHHTKYRRYIDGIPTNECVSIYENHSVYYYGNAFTEEDMDKLPDLASAIYSAEIAFNSGEISPPHIANYPHMELRDHGVIGWYFKANSKVYGVVQVSFTYCENSNTHNSDCFYDDIYYLAEYGSNICQEIDRDALLELQGTQDFIFTGEYDKNGKLPIG